MPLPPDCQAIQDQIDNLETRIDHLATLLSGASGPMKASLLRRIRALNNEAGARERELHACMERHNVPTPPPPLATVFNFTATLTTTDPRAPGPFMQQNLSMGLLFDSDRTDVTVTSFPPFQTPPFPTPAGQNTTTVSLLGSGFGTFNPQTGDLALVLSLLFDHSIDWPFVTEDSTMNGLILGTRMQPGSPLNRQTRAMTLVGTAQFTGGILGGTLGTLVLAGQLRDLP